MSGRPPKRPAEIKVSTLELPSEGGLVLHKGQEVKLEYSVAATTVRDVYEVVATRMDGTAWPEFIFTLRLQRREFLACRS